MTGFPTDFPYTVETARKILAVVDQGLVRGVGDPEAGKMCVEASICYALGLPHGDDPGCVASSIRAFKIRLNDSAWSSDHARALGLRALAIAQLGSKNVINETDFSRRLVDKTIRIIVPIALRRAGLEVEALRCEQEGTREAARAGITAAAAAAASAATADAASADAAAASASYAAASAAATAATAYASAASAAASAAYAADAAAYAAYADEVLTCSADLVLSILRELNAPGLALWDAVNTVVNPTNQEDTK